MVRPSSFLPRKYAISTCVSVIEMSVDRCVTGWGLWFTIAIRIFNAFEVRVPESVDIVHVASI